MLSGVHTNHQSRCFLKLDIKVGSWAKTVQGTVEVAQVRDASGLRQAVSRRENPGGFNGRFVRVCDGLALDKDRKVQVAGGSLAFTQKQAGRG